MGAIDTQYTFTATDTITSTKMNNIIDQTTITGTAITGTTLEVASGQLKIRSQGITSNEMGADSVLAISIKDLNVTTAKIADSAITLTKMANDSVGTNQIVDASITAPMLNGTQTGLAPIYGVRAWVRFNGNKNSSGSVDASNTARQILGSGNVTSVTKVGTGLYTVDFALDLPSANYAVAGHRAYESGDLEGVTIQADPGTPQTAGLFKFYTIAAGSAVPANSSDVQIMFIG